MASVRGLINIPIKEKTAPSPHTNHPTIGTHPIKREITDKMKPAIPIPLRLLLFCRIIIVCPWLGIFSSEYDSFDIKIIYSKKEAE